MSGVLVSACAYAFFVEQMPYSSKTQQGYAMIIKYPYLVLNNLFYYQKQGYSEMQTMWKSLLRKFIIELILYAMLVVIYFLLVLRYLGDWLTSFFSEKPVIYAVIALVLIVAQGFTLEAITSFLIERLNLERFE